VPDDVSLRGTGVVDHPHDVARQGVEVVGRDRLRLVAEVVPPLVRSEDAEAGGGERLDLMAPGVPEFGEAVEEDHQRTPFGARLDRVQADAVGGDRAVA